MMEVSTANAPLAMEPSWFAALVMLLIHRLHQRKPVALHRIDIFLDGERYFRFENEGVEIDNQRLEFLGEELAMGQRGAPGKTVTYTLRISNTGECADTFTLSRVGAGWPNSRRR